MKIIALNTRSVSKYLGFEVKRFENLMENPKCQKFIEENMEYLTANDPTLLIDFYKKTGIILEHKYEKRRSFSNSTINFLGVLQFNYAPRNKYLGPFTPLRSIYNAHLVVIDQENIIEQKGDYLYINDKKVRSIKKEVDDQKDRYDKFVELNDRLIEIYDNQYYYDDIEIEKRDLILYPEEKAFLDNYPNYKEKNDIEQLVVTPYNDIFTLTGDGIVYCNNDVYAKDVEYIFEQDTINKIMIYNDCKSIEYISASSNVSLYGKYDKVVYGDTFSHSLMAFLDGKKVTIITRPLGTYILDESSEIELEGIDDIRFDCDRLVLIIGDREVIYE